ncbi:phage integrase N-terminal SAM-like domain-containing protein [Aliikangiella sp. IMCC44653]
MTEKPRLMWLLREKIRTMQYLYYTEKRYVFWIMRFIHFHNLCYPKGMSSNKILVEIKLTDHIKFSQPKMSVWRPG